MLICIYMNSRSGSSLITKIFHVHGAWVGSTRTDKNTAKNGKPAYPVYEWLEMKHAIKPPGEGWKTDGTLLEVKPESVKRVAGLMAQRKEDRFIVKGIPDYHKYFIPYEPRIIKIRRKIDSVHQSQDTSGEWQSVTERRVKLMETLPGVYVDTDEVISGDFTSLRAAFHHCDMTFNEKLAEQQIERNLWHHV